MEGADVVAAPGSLATSVEYNELEELGMLLSRRPLPFLPKMLLPKICTLSGRSRKGTLLLDRPEDFLEMEMFSIVKSHEGRRSEVSDFKEEPEEVTGWLL